MAMIARRHGMRLIGPNCVGVVNPTLRTRWTRRSGRSARRPAVSRWRRNPAGGHCRAECRHPGGYRNLEFVSLGNKADISSNDLLQYWEDDPRTDVICLYLESFGNPSKFARSHARVGQNKPIVAVKSGRTPAGRRTASSHTAALASDDSVVDALFRQCGVLRVDTIDELLDTTLVLADQPLTAGSRLAIIGNSGGPAIMAVDACAGSGIELAELSSATVTGWDRSCPRARSTRIPSTSSAAPVRPRTPRRSGS